MTTACSPLPSTRRLALFDLDHTLLPIDSDYEWNQFMGRIGWCDAEEAAAKNAAFYAQYCAGTLDLNAYTRFVTEPMRSKGPEASEAAHAQFMHEVIEPVIRQEALQLLDQHRQAGDEIIIITATNEFVAGPIAKRLGVEAFMGVKLAKDASGWYSGDIDGVPSSREGKVIRMQEWLKARNLDWGDVHTSFYSDSHNDLPLLKQVNHPVATNPDATLRAHALQNDWQILELFPSTSTHS